MADLWHTLVALFTNLLTLGEMLLHLVIAWALLIAWVLWWLCAVNWVKAWDWLAKGAWVGVVLLVVLGAAVWSEIAPRDLSLGFMHLPNFWWQLGGTTLLAGLALFCGWLQGVLGWMPNEIPIYPEGAADDTHGHEHAVGALHGHDQFHEDEP